jgi:GNAT superfamily N-acetyltransferase
VPLQIERIDDEAGARALHELDQATIVFDHPGLTPEPLDDIVGMLGNPLDSFHIHFFLGREGDDIVAAGIVFLPMVDNLHSCDVHVVVALDARRRGVGAEMARFLFETSRMEGRRTFRGFVGAPLGGTSPGNAMAASFGATAALGSIRRELRLAELDRGAMEARLKELSGGPGAPYDVVSWLDTIPDELVDGAAAILPRVMSDSPRGELDMEDEVWDAARYRDYEAMFAARRRHQLATAAIDRSSGRLVAFTDLNVPYTDDRTVSQYGTVVEPDFRGHRLGLIVKTANLVNLLDRYPGAETVQTYNATENAHMIAVNEELGFRAVEQNTIWQLEI